MGCGTLTPIKDSSVHHVLEPLVPYRALAGIRPSMAINRPSIPSYLDRQQLITRDHGLLMISQLDLWGEPLDLGIARVTATNLSRLTGSSNIQPVENFVSLDYTTLLELRITRFEPDHTNQLILEGTWKLQPIHGGETRNHFYQIYAEINTAAPPMSARVDAMNLCLERLARQISKSTLDDSP